MGRLPTPVALPGRPVPDSSPVNENSSGLFPPSPYCTTTSPHPTPSNTPFTRGQQLTSDYSGNTSVYRRRGGRHSALSDGWRAGTVSARGPISADVERVPPSMELAAELDPLSILIQSRTRLKLSV
ncbi:hypothetical protein EVAR_18436_1 [Eumeta japonica]|uniref:Uncharacterized protein n=1 Tax=Eumeta variegata TaxID=151549 RepID=A0A4C1UVD7_EUMVA|nr:hypothetical protein EVAR_18436_1 [Eumeta japonica]